MIRCSDGMRMKQFRKLLLASQVLAQEVGGWMGRQIKQSINKHNAPRTVHNSSRLKQCCMFGE